MSLLLKKAAQEHLATNSSRLHLPPIIATLPIVLMMAKTGGLLHGVLSPESGRSSLAADMLKRIRALYEKHLNTKNTI
ncbi:hypothetical protein [Pseudomonas fluorescens]|uniref:hypothetical protein n=1 Tax=Pseudomonas fluorescens TaxID=294 RepID=UPI0012422EAA|nr:hypothetical protein [Pseudomonas fluorescens]